MAEPPQLLVQFQNVAGRLLAHPGAGYAELRYEPGRRPPEALAQLLTALGQLLLRHGWRKFLADNRQLDPLTEAEKDWFAAQWLQSAALRPAALMGVIVLPEAVYARLSFQQMYLQANTLAAGIRYRTFTSYEQAQACVIDLS